MKKYCEFFATCAGLGFALWLAGGIAGCALNSRSLPMPEQLILLGVVPADTDPDRLKKGRVLAVTECMECHRFYWPGEYSPGQWKDILRRMAPLSSLTQSQAEDLEVYMIAAARTVDTDQVRDP